MKASVRWLRELCPQLPDDPAEIAARFTRAGLEVEAIEPFGVAADACVVASVVSTRPHPSRSGLRLVTVDRGGARQEVVCGAPNVPDPGGLVVLAPLGAHLPAKGITIAQRTIAGVPSEGMLCSEAELGLGGDGGGILVLAPGAATLGDELSAALAASRDTLFEIGLTPNRPDGLGHVGLAREAAALFEVPFALPTIAAGAVRDEDLSRYVTVDIADPERCPHFGAAVVLDVRVAPSPLEVRWRLESLGVRAISNLVDVSNLVMLESGHPMHAFDLDHVRGGEIHVRRAHEGERFHTLDGNERVLTGDDLVVCDGEGPLSLAGVMGGRDSEITAGTSRVLLECAYFDPRGVRRTARRHGLHTESSHRFERGVDWGDTAWVVARAVSLLAALGGGTPVREQRVFEARALARRTIALRHSRVSRSLGVDVPPAEATAILERLGFGRRASPPSGPVGPHGAADGSTRPDFDVWDVPSYRPDVSREMDLVDEVARVRGLDSVPAVLPPMRPTRDAGPRESLGRRARAAAVGLGLSEALTYSFATPRELEAVGAPPAAVTLRNPLSERGTVLRTSLLPGLLRALGLARRHGVHDARLFTVGTLFMPPAEGPAPDERVAFAALLAGDRPGWLRKPEPSDVWDAKGVALGLVERLLRRDASVRLCAEADRPARLHPRGAATIDVDGKPVGTLGPLHPDVLDAFGLDGGALVVEIDLLTLEALGVAPVRFSPLPRFPPSARDLAVVVKDDVLAGDVERAVREAAGDLAEHVGLFDRFVGGGVPAGHASLALHVVYRAPDRTLTDAEVDQRHTRVVAEITARFGASLRA